MRFGFLLLSDLGCPDFVGNTSHDFVGNTSHDFVGNTSLEMFLGLGLGTVITLICW